MGEVVTFTRGGAKETTVAKETPVTRAAWLFYEDQAMNYVHVFQDYSNYWYRAETTDQERRNLAAALHDAHDRLTDAERAYQESFGICAEGK